MQAPKDGDSAVLQVQASPDIGARIEDYVTRNCTKAPDPRGTHAEKYGTPEGIKRIAALGKPEPARVERCDFERGFSEGLGPISMGAVRSDGRVNADVHTYRLGDASVQVSGLELLQATDVEALGRVKGAELRELFRVKHQRALRDLTPTNEPALRTIEARDGTVPVPQVLGWTGGGASEGPYGRLIIGIEGREVAYAPEKPDAFGEWLRSRPQPLRRGRPQPLQDFDAWLRNPYTAAVHQHIARLQTAIAKADGELSRVLHELAGAAMQCNGRDNGAEAIKHVEHAIGELRGILRDV